MHKPLSCLLMVLVCSCHWLQAQIAPPDSIVAQLKAAPDDTNKVMLYWKAGASVIYQDGQAAMNYFKAGTALAKKLDYTSGTERCLNATSFAVWQFLG